MDVGVGEGVAMDVISGVGKGVGVDLGYGHGYRCV